MGADATNTNVNPEVGAESTQEQPKSFDELLKEDAYKTEYEKRLSKELESAKSKWESEQQTKLNEEKTEAQKMASMNEKEKEDYQRQKREEVLEQREREITARELKATAYETLSEKGLPKELAEILNYTDADQCKASIDAVEKAFQSSVEKAVNEKLRGNNQPPKSGGGDANNSVFGFGFTGVRPKK